MSRHLDGAAVAASYVGVVLLFALGFYVLITGGA